MFYKYSNGELVNKAKGVKPVRVFTLTPELHELIVHYSLVTFFLVCCSSLIDYLNYILLVINHIGSFLLEVLEYLTIFFYMQSNMPND